jgi:hypothetical protein
MVGFFTYTLAVDTTPSEENFFVAVYDESVDLPFARTEYVDEKNAQTETKLTELSEKKVDKEEGKGLSTNDYTDEDKTKVGFIGLEIGNQGELLDNFLLVLEEAHYYRSQCGPCTFYIGDQIVCGTYFMNETNPPDGGIDEFVIFSQDFSETEAQGHASLYIMGISIWGSDVDIYIKKRFNLSDLSFDVATQSEIDALFEGSSTGGSSTSY